MKVILRVTVRVSRSTAITDLSDLVVTRAVSAIAELLVKDVSNHINWSHFFGPLCIILFRTGLFDMALKNLGFLRFFFKNLKNLKSPNLGFLGFLENKNLMFDLSF